MLNKYNSLNNNNESYFLDQYFSDSLSCNRPNSFANFKQEECRADNDDQLRSLLSAFAKVDTTRFSFINSLYSLLASYNQYMNDSCKDFFKNKTELIECILNGSNPAIIKPYLKNITLDQDSKGLKNVKIFDSDTCNGYHPEYTIYHIQGTVNQPVYNL